MRSSWLRFILLFASSAISVGEEHPIASNLFGSCKWLTSPDPLVGWPLWNDKSPAIFHVNMKHADPMDRDSIEYKSLPLTLSQVNEKLALGLVRGQPQARAWAAREEKSWQYPPTHPRRNRTNCLLLNNASVEHPISVYETMRSLAEDFYTLTAKNVLVHESGIVAAGCGYFQPLEGCETMFKFIGRKWHQKCSQQLHKQRIDWTVATSPSSPLLLERNDTAQPATSPLCREPSMEPWTYARRLFVISSLWDHNYHHLLVDVLPRLVYHLPFLRANPDILLHVRRSERLNKPAVAARNRAMKHRVFELLGLSPQRLVSGPVVASQVVVPRAIRCNFPVQNAREVRLTMRALLAASQRILAAQDASSAPPPPFTRLAPTSADGQSDTTSLPRTILLQVRHCHREMKCDSWRTWADGTASSVLQALRLQFPSAEILVANDSAISTSAVGLASELRAYQSVDLLVGLHGAGLTNLMFMPPGGVVFEITGQYDGRMMVGCGYHGGLASIFGVHHYLYYYDWRGGEAVQAQDVAQRAQAFYLATRRPRG